MFLYSLYGVGLYAAYFAGAMLHRLNASKSIGNKVFGKRRLPYFTLFMTVIIAIPSILGLIYPSVIKTLGRDYSRFLSGEWWRLITSLFVQDGGTAGTVFNLVGLLFVGSVAEQYWSRKRWIFVFLGGGIISQLIAFAWQPVGAGNSVANFSLAGSILIVCLFSHPPRIVLVSVILSLAVDAWLLYIRNIHGAAVMVGATIAIILILRKRHKQSGFSLSKKIKQAN